MECDERSVESKVKMHNFSRHWIAFKDCVYSLFFFLYLALFPDENVERVLGTYAEEEVKGWSTRWVVRYSVVVKCRGVIKNKG